MMMILHLIVICILPIHVMVATYRHAYQFSEQVCGPPKTSVTDCEISNKTAHALCMPVTTYGYPCVLPAEAAFSEAKRLYDLRSGRPALRQQVLDGTETYRQIRIVHATTKNHICSVMALLIAFVISIGLEYVLVFRTLGLGYVSVVI